MDGPTLNTTIQPKKRSGSGGKNAEKVLEQWVSFKIAGSVKGKGRNKVKVGVASTATLHKNSTIDLKKKQLFKAMNLRNSPKYGQGEPMLKLKTKSSPKNTVVLIKSKLKT